MCTTQIIIGAFSARHYEDRRQACRDTWAGNLPEEVDMIFLVGDPQAKLPYRAEDVLYCPCPDNYESLPQKTRWFCAWALANTSFEFLFKCDDDTYVAVDRLLKVRLEHDYVGHDMGGYASGGAGYFLSRRAAFAVSTRMLQPTGVEDMLVQQVLKDVDIPFVPEPRLYAWSNQCPQSDNELVSAHHCNPQRLRRIHRELTERFPPRKESFRLWAEHPHWRDKLILFDDGTFTRGVGDGGEYELKPREELLLNWDCWPAEGLQWNQDKNLFSSPEKAFTLRYLSSPDVTMARAKDILCHSPSDMNATSRDVYLTDIQLDGLCGKGRRIAADSAVAIAGLARSCGEAIRLNIPRIEQLGSYFRDYQVYVYENDSSDDTRETLREWRDANHRVHISLNDLGKTHYPPIQTQDRTRDMAFYRNQCIRMIELGKFNYVVVFDFDILGGFCYDGIMRSLASSLDVVGSNSLWNGGRYYDTFALRPLDDHPLAWHWNPCEMPFEVESCFGGLALYRSECFEGVHYSGDDCEHVCLHRQMRQLGRRIWLNPSQLVFYDRMASFE